MRNRSQTTSSRCGVTSTCRNSVVPRLPRRYHGLRTALIAALSFAPALAHAQTDRWKGGDGYWDVAAQWSLGAPTSAEDVENDTAGTITFRQAIVFINSFLSTSSGGFNLTSGTLNVKSNFTASGPLNLTGGTLCGVHAGFSNLQVNNTSLLDGGTLQNFTVNPGVQGGNTYGLTFTANDNNLLSGVESNATLDIGASNDNAVANIANNLLLNNTATVSNGGHMDFVYGSANQYSLFVKTSGEVYATFQGQTATYDDHLYLNTPVNNLNEIFFNHGTPVGARTDLGYFSAGTELIFRMHVDNTGNDFYNGDPIRNPDDHLHALVNYSYSPTETLVGFEDLLHGPFNYNDLGFSLTNVQSAVTLNSVAGKTGDVLLGSSGSGSLNVEDGVNLIIGSGITVHGANGSIGSRYQTSASMGNSVTNLGTINSDGGGTLTINPDVFTNNGTLSATNGSSLALEGTTTKFAGGHVNIDSTSSLSAAASITQTGGTTTVDGNLSVPSTKSLLLQGGSLGGNGTVNGNVSNTGGTVKPGDVLGTLTINGNYTQSTTGKMEIDLGGTQQGLSYDLLSVVNKASLAGELDVQLVNGFTPAVGETFDFLTYGSHSGQFSEILPFDNGYQYNVTYSSGMATLVVTVAAVPESSTFVTAGLMLGAGGLLLRRRRRTEETAKRAA